MSGVRIARMISRMRSFNPAVMVGRVAPCEPGFGDGASDAPFPKVHGKAE